MYQGIKEKIMYGKLPESRQYCMQNLAGTRQETMQEQCPETRKE